MTDLSAQLHHAPGCSDDEGTSNTIGHTVTTTRCLKCGAIATARHVHHTPPAQPRATTERQDQP